MIMPGLCARLQEQLDPDTSGAAPGILHGAAGNAAYDGAELRGLLLRHGVWPRPPAPARGRCRSAALPWGLSLGTAPPRGGGCGRRSAAMPQAAAVTGTGGPSYERASPRLDTECTAGWQHVHVLCRLRCSWCDRRCVPRRYNYQCSDRCIETGRNRCSLNYRCRVDFSMNWAVSLGNGERAECAGATMCVYYKSRAKRWADAVTR